MPSPSKIKNVVLIYRPESDRTFKMAQEVTQWFQKRKITVFTDPDLPTIPGSKKLTSALLKKLDLVVVLGGDGTFLKAVRLLEGEQVPVLGINMGSLGFLTETRVEEAFDVLALALKGKLERKERATIRATIHCKNGKKKSYVALNDIVLERGAVTRLIDMVIYFDSFLVSTVKADGLIISTPTGSTAYSLAAGGPIVHPDVPGLAITPICPHTLTNRPFILPDNDKIKLKLNQHPGEAVFMVDGQRCQDLTWEDELIIEKNKCNLVMLSVPSRSYFEILRTKLKFGQRE